MNLLIVSCQHGWRSPFGLFLQILTCQVDRLFIQSTVLYEWIKSKCYKGLCFLQWRESSLLRFIGLIFVSSAHPPFLKALELSNSSPDSLILIWIQLIECSFRPALSQFPSLPSTLVKTFANFPRKQISSAWLPTPSRCIAPHKQTNRTVL